MSQKELPKANILASAKAKADEYAIKNDKSGRARTKQAILQELNNQMQLRAEKMRLINKDEDDISHTANVKDRNR